MIEILFGVVVWAILAGSTGICVLTAFVFVAPVVFGFVEWIGRRG